MAHAKQLTYRGPLIMATNAELQAQVQELQAQAEAKNKPNKGLWECTIKIVNSSANAFDETALGVCTLARAGRHTAELLDNQAIYLGKVQHNWIAEELTKLPAPPKQ